MAENENICFLCEYMRVIDKPGNKWAPTFCEHPDSMYIKNYRKTHNVKSAERFVGWTKRYSKELTIKTRPRWCPIVKIGNVTKMSERMIQMNIELKPCPFCGSKRVYRHRVASNNRSRIYCFDCGIGTPYFLDIKDAEKIWNRRAKDD